MSIITETEKTLQAERRKAANALRAAHLRLAETDEQFDGARRVKDWWAEAKPRARQEDEALEHAVDAVANYVLARIAAS